MNLRDQVRFWGQVKVGVRCWEWTGTKDKWGYGKFTAAGKTWMAHRYAWTITHGEIPSNKFICHHCDVPACVNPEHLYVGDQRSNMDDLLRRERSTRGERNASAVLQAEEVTELRRLWLTGAWTQKALAAKFGIGATQASRIIRRERWRHL